jgi:hypothetical protein
MMRASLIPIAAALVLAAAGAATGSAAHEDAGQPPVVDVFPAQSWVSLGAEQAPDTPAASPPVAEPEPEPPALDAPIDAPPAAPVPFEIIGEWRENGRRVVALEGMGRTVLLCDARCGVRDAVLPGGEIADGYRLKKLGGQGAVIVARDSTDVELSLPVSPN